MLISECKFYLLFMKNLRLKSVIQKSIISLFLAFFLITLISNAKAANIVQAATGNWNAGATWVGGVVPTSADDVTLLGNRTCTVNISNAACNTITIPNNGATGAPCALRFNVNSQLTVSGSVTMGTGGTRSANVDMTSGGTLICNGFVLGVGTKNFISGVGTVVLNATFTIPNTILTTFNNLTLNGGTITAPSGTLNITGNFVTNSNFVHNSGTLYPQIGLNYYRLTQFDTDGNYKQYDPVSVKNTTLSENTIVVYPNPGREVLKLELNNSEIEGEVILEIFNESGLLIETRNAYIQPGYNNLIVEGFNANNGIYFIQVRNEEFSSERVIYIKQ